MPQDLLSFFEYLEYAKGISREDIIPSIANAIASAAKKNAPEAKEVRVDINPKTGVLKAWAQYKVVDSVTDNGTQIHISQAQKKDPTVQLGAILEEPLDPSLLGRIAAQTARQIISQNIRRLERGHIYEQFQDQVGSILQGVLRFIERGNLLIDFGQAEGTLFRNEAVWSDRFVSGDSVSCLLQGIKETSHGPELMLTRVHPDFVRKLLEREIPELTSTPERPARIQIKAIVRDPGYRTKICVTSTDSAIDPVGACIGSHGSRIKCVLKELGQEKIDVIRYSDDLRTFINEIARPAVPQSLSIDEAAHTIQFKLAEKDFAIFVGKSGRNLKLASQLLGYEIQVEHTDTPVLTFEDKKIQAMQTLMQYASIADATAAKLVDMGVNSPEILKTLSEEDLIAAGIEEAERHNILNSPQPAS